MSKESLKALVIGMGKPEAAKKPEPDDTEEESGEYEVGSDEEHGQAMLDAFEAKDAKGMGAAMRAVAMACMSDDDSGDEGLAGVAVGDQVGTRHARTAQGENGNLHVRLCCRGQYPR